MLLTKPRPSMPLRFRVRGAESIPLHVVALRGVEYTDALAASDGIDEPGPAASARMCSLIAASVHTTDGLAFQSGEQVGLLDETEVIRFGVDVYSALAIISPISGYIEHAQWIATLKKGAEHASNYMTAMRVASCIDIVGGFTKVVRTPRPDRWFGMPVSDLTDGQLLAYDAARMVFERDR